MKTKFPIQQMNRWIDLPYEGLKTCPKEIVGLTVELDFGDVDTVTVDDPENWKWINGKENMTNCEIIRYRVIGLKA